MELKKKKTAGEFNYNQCVGTNEGACTTGYTIRYDDKVYTKCAQVK